LQETGFAPIVPAKVPITDAPTAAELDALRTRVDLTGRLGRKPISG
jgi:hypothetical protein